LITSGPIFDKETILFQNWVQGIKYTIKDEAASSTLGTYALTVNYPSGSETFTVEMKSGTNITMTGRDTLQTRFCHDGTIVKLSYAPKPPAAARPAASGGAGSRGGVALPANAIHLSGINNGDEWNGTG